MRNRISKAGALLLSLLLAGAAEAAITNLAVQDSANAADWSVQSNLQVGSVQYGDRAFTFSSVAAAVAGADWIRTANDSKAFTGATLVSFTVTTDSDVYVAHNDSISPKPSWLTSANGWTDSGGNLVNNESTPRTFSLFRKAFAAGAAVSLGNNGSTTSGQYTIVVVSTGTVVTPTPTPTATATPTATPTPTPPTTGPVKLTVVAASASTNDGNVPANTLDGSLATRWSGNGDGAWIQFDLGSVQSIALVKIAVYNGNSRQNAFDLQVGDGSSFATVLPGAHTSGTTTQLETFDLNPDQNARFVRYVGHMSNVGTFNSVTEVEIWGNPCADCPTPTPTPPTPTPTPTVATPTPTPSPTPRVRPTPNGNPILPPKWAFGVLYGSYHNQTQILDDMSRIRSGGYGGDALWVDSSWLSSDYNDAPKYINFTFDPGQFPSPATMTSTLHSNHFRFGLWEWPYIDKSNSLYSTGVSKGAFIKNSSGDVVDGGGWHGVTFTGQFDFTNPAAVTWFKQLEQPVLDKGVDFFKIDTYGTVPSGGVLFSGGNSGDTYKQAYHKTVFEVTQSALSSQGRGLIFAHRQSAGNNIRFPGLWTGDIASTWAGLQTAIDRAKAFNTTGTAAYWTGDTGGYNSGNPTDELYIRWLEYGTFQPINEFFAEKASKTRFPWVFGTQAQAVFKQYAQLRYRLLPWRYSNAQACYHEMPMKWPVSWASGTNQMLVGNGASQMMVGIVTAAGATSRSVTFPSGTWIDYWTGASHAGGTTATVSAPLDRVPLFVKAGSIVPMGPQIEWVDQLPADPLTLDTYPSGTSSYTLYEDDGLSLAYQGGAVSRTTLTSDAAAATFSIGAAVGSYAGQLADRTYILKIHQQTASPGAVSRDGGSLTQHSSQSAFDGAAEGWFYDGAADVLWVKFHTSTSVSTQVNY
jgi:cell division septation protein DedD